MVYFLNSNILVKIMLLSDGTMPYFLIKTIICCNNLTKSFCFYCSIKLVLHNIIGLLRHASLLEI